MLLNRAPTLHRLGIQAFEPVLVEGKALQIHPLVCTAFNADFDGDQMAIHVPLSAEAQAEARVLMLSANNILSPASGRPIVTPIQDLIIGGYYLTEFMEDAKGAGRVFRHRWEVLRALDEGSLEPALARSRCAARRSATGGRDVRDHRRPPAVRRGTARRLHRSASVTSTTWSRRRRWVSSSSGSPTTTRSRQVAASLDAIKNVCYRYASQSGLTVSIDDVKTPKAKKALLDGYEAQADKVETQFRRGIITDGERRQQEVRIWTDATAEVQEAMEVEFKAQRFNPIDMMVGSGARGNMTQMRQIAGMRGLVANPRGDMIPRPIKKNFREGLETLEYFIATPGARKGLVDTALRTADSGLPDPSSRRRRPGADRPRGRLRHQPRSVDRERRTPTRPTSVPTSRPSCSVVRCCKTSRSADGTVLAQEHASSATRDGRAARRSRRQPRPRPFGAHVRCRARRLRAVLRPFAGHRQVDRARRGRRRHRRPVDRRARYPADDAYLPHRWCGRQGHRRWSASRRRAVRGPHASRLGPSGRASGVVRIAEDEGKGIPVTVIDDQGEEHLVILPTGSRPDRHRRSGHQGRRPDHRRSLRPEGDHGDQGHPRDPAVPRRRGPEGVPRPGCVDPATSTSS